MNPLIYQEAASSQAEIGLISQKQLVSIRLTDLFYQTVQIICIKYSECVYLASFLLNATFSFIAKYKRSVHHSMYELVHDSNPNIQYVWPQWLNKAVTRNGFTLSTSK